MTQPSPSISDRVAPDDSALAGGGVPAVSVVMPVHNAEAYLDRAITSVISQSEEDFELLLIDDASVDATPDIARRWAAFDPRVRVESSPSRGIVAALNRGLQLAAAPLIARMDGDDVCLPTRFAAQRAFLAAHGEVVAVGCGFAFVDERERPLCVVDPLLEHDAILAAYGRHEAMPLCHPTTMFRTADARAIGGYDPSFQGLGSEDLDFFLRLACRGRLANLPSPLLLCRKHAQSYTRRADFDWKAMHVARRRAVVNAFQSLGRPSPAEPPRPIRGHEKRPGHDRLHMAFLAWWGAQWSTAIRHGFAAFRIGPPRAQAVILLGLSLMGVVAGGGLRRLWGRRYTKRGRPWPGHPVPASLDRSLTELDRKLAAASHRRPAAVEAPT